MRILNTLPVRAKAFDVYLRLLPLQGVTNERALTPGCRFACPGLGAVALSGRAC